MSAALLRRAPDEPTLDSVVAIVDAAGRPLARGLYVCFRDRPEGRRCNVRLESGALVEAVPVEFLRPA